MSVIAFICYFFPAVLSLWLFESLTKCSLSLKQCIFRFCGNVLFINFICFAIKKFILHTANLPILYGEVDMLPAVAFNYIVIALPAGLLLVLTEVLLSKKLKVTVEENNDETYEK